MAPPLPCSCKQSVDRQTDRRVIALMLNVNVSRYGSITKQATTDGATTFVNLLQQVSNLTLAISTLALSNLTKM